MKAYLSKLNSKIEGLVGALKTADSMIAKPTDQKNLLESIKEKKLRGDQQSVSQYFKDKIS